MTHIFQVSSDLYSLHIPENTDPQNYQTQIEMWTERKSGTTEQNKDERLTINLLWKNYRDD